MGNKDGKMKTKVVWKKQHINRKIALDEEACAFFKNKFGCIKYPTELYLQGYFNSYFDYDLLMVVTEKRKRSNMYENMKIAYQGTSALHMDTYNKKFLCIMFAIKNDLRAEVLLGSSLKEQSQLIDKNAY